MPIFKRKDQHGFGEKKSLISLLFSPFTAFFGFVFSLLGGSDDGLGQKVPLFKRIWRGALSLLFFPFWFVFQILKFIVLSWTTTRDGNSALWGMVPLAGIVVLIAIVVASNIFQDRRILKLHLTKAKEFRIAEDHDKAILFSRRTQNISSSESLKFEHAMTLEAAGKKENSILVMKELAQPEVAGFLPAHIFLAKKLTVMEDDDPDKQAKLSAARQHLERVIDKSPGDNDPNFMVASTMLPQVIFYQGDVESAMEMYKGISNVAPEVVAELAQFLIDNGKDADAEFHIGRGIDRIKQIANSNPNIRHLWIWMRDILMVRKEYDRCVTELNYGLQLATSPAIKGMIMKLQSDVLIEFSRNFTDIDTQDGFREKLVPVCQAMQRFPRNPVAIEEFVTLILFPPNDEVVDWLEEEARENVSPSVYHIINGIRDSIYGKPATGQQHFRLAFNGDNRAAIVINDIAKHLGEKRGRYEDSLALVDVAIETWSSSAKLFQTRGDILRFLNRHAEAVPELEYALEKIQSDPRILTSLADCYEKLDRAEEAADFRERAKILEEEIEIKTQEFLDRLSSGEEN